MVRVGRRRWLGGIAATVAGCSGVNRGPDAVQSHTPGNATFTDRRGEPDPDEAVETPTPPPRGPRTDIDTARVERLVVPELNKLRSGTAPPVFEDPRLSAIARRKSYDMATEGYFAHEGPDGRTAGDRLDEANYQCYKTGETLLKTHWKDPIEGNDGEAIRTEPGLADRIVESLASSPPHRATMENPVYERVGVGVYVTENGVVYATLLFCDPFR